MALFEDGTVLSRYTILGKLATGGMAEVYLARQSGPSGFSKLLVLKVILPHLAENPEFLNMFHNEAKLAALLNHPNVVQIFDFGQENWEQDKVQYMAMEYIDGLNLRAIVKALDAQGAQIPRPIAIRLVSDACSALEYAHSLTGPDGSDLEIIHRDVSLANILLTYTGQVKLVDFGIAKASHLESFTSKGALRGKYRYMAPEHLRGTGVDQRVDIFSLGVMLYRLITGKLPFDGDNHAQLIERIANRPPPRPTALCGELPEELERITLKALAKNPDDRYQRAGELQIDLEAHLVDAGHAVMPYNLSRFMEEAFPPGEDELRVRYQRLAGITSRTPPQQRRPDGTDQVTVPVPQTEAKDPATGPMPLVEEEPVPARELQATEIDPAAGPLPDAPEQDEQIPARELQATEIDPAAGPLPEDAAQEPPTGPLPQVVIGAEAGKTDDLKSTLVHPDDKVPAEALATMQDALDNAPTAPVSAASGLSEEETRQLTDEDIRETQVPAKETLVPAIEDIFTQEKTIPMGKKKPADGDGLDDVPTRLRPTEKVKALQTKRSPMIWVALVLFLLAGGGTVAYFVLGQGGERAATPPPQQADAAPARPDQAPAAADMTAPDLEVAAQDAAAAVQAAPDQAAPDQAAATPDLAVPDQPGAAPDQPPPPPDAPPADPAAAPPARLSVSCSLGGDVIFNGKRLGKVPLRDVEVPSGKGRLVLRNRRKHFSITRNLNLASGAHKRLQLTPRMGTIKILVRPWAKVTLDGKSLGTTPLAPVEAYEGRHLLLLVNDKLGAKKRERVTVRAGKQSVVKVRLGK